MKYQVLGACDRTGAEKYIWPDRQLKKNFFFLFSVGINLSVSQKFAFGSLLGNSK